MVAWALRSPNRLTAEKKVSMPPLAPAKRSAPLEDSAISSGDGAAPEGANSRADTFSATHPSLRSPIPQKLNT